MKAFVAALRALRRDWRAGELRVLALALVVAVASVTAVGFFTERVERAMVKEGATLLAADLRVESSYAIGDEIREQAGSLGLMQSEIVTFPSVLIDDDDNTQLIGLKAAADGYPLRGSLRTADEPFGEDAETDALPQPGEVWLDPRPFARLGLEIGDRVLIGASEFRISRVLSYEPDRGGGFVQLAPRALIHMDDLPATRLIHEASRVRYRLLLAGSDPAIAQMENWLDTYPSDDIEIEGLRNARPELRAAIERAESFLGLAALVAVILSGAAIAVAANGFAERQADAVAVMRCLGAQQRYVLQVLIFRLLLIGLIASVAGAALGAMAQGVLSFMLSQFFGGELPAAGMEPLFAGLATGMVALLGFALPPVVRLRRVPVLRVLRRDLGMPSPSALLVALSALLAVGALMVWQAGNLTLAALVIAGCVATLGVLAALAFVALKLLRRMRGGTLLGWRFGLANLARRAQSSTLALVAFGVGIMALLLLSIVRVDLLSAWQAELPADAPNHFLINVQPDEVERLRARLNDAEVTPRGLFPMIRGRLLSINGEPVSEANYPEDPRAQRLATRDFNLSFSTKTRDDNPLVDGDWAPMLTDTPQWSVESGIAETLGIELGDELVYRVAGSEITGTVANFRQVDWDSFEVNFFVIGNPATLAESPATYITSFHLPQTQTTLVPSIVREFPSITVIDVDALMARVREIMSRAATAVEFVFVFTLLAGVVVLMAAVQASRSQRVREAALLRTLGAGRRQVLSGLATEFAALGLLAGLLAAGTASLVGWAVATRIFDLEYALNPAIWLIGTLGGALGVGLVGMLATRSVLSRPPASVLRSAL